MRKTSLGSGGLEVMDKQWSKREAQILAVGMVGDLQGIADKATPEIVSEAKAP